jgi:hypothetical protein
VIPGIAQRSCAVQSHARHRGLAVRWRKPLSRLRLQRPTHSRSVNRFYIPTANNACASSTGRVLDSLLFENRCVLLPRNRAHVPSGQPSASSCEETHNRVERNCLACANHRNWLVPMRRAQDANSRSAYRRCQADSCTRAQFFLIVRIRRKEEGGRRPISYLLSAAASRQSP